MNQNGALAFGMSRQDFRGNFFCLFICNQVPISLDHGPTLPERWSQLMFKNHLIPGNAEGSYDIGNYSARWEAASLCPIPASALNGPRF
ncbi:hypothetical protein J1605_012091 [Eschrichtius robustus]|uniref:Uncharacterized protein n=1 Tax=Eschrichtius robustus TaxID=9764 RepID=A0AB34GL14_ESCRO|nr:hypothetical protein J1605_012091 [Eschrichtius robustus]